MIKIETASVADAKEILALQKLAFQSEAALYNDFHILPLTQTLESMQDDLGKQYCLKAVEEGRIIGSVRAELRKGTCHIMRLIVHPDLQKQGLGTRLMQEIEKHFASAKRFELGTGHLSVSNLRLYQKMGYRELRREKYDEKVITVILGKRN